MLIRMPHYYREFTCAASRCPDTCCSCWEVVLDGETADFYAKAPGALGDEVRKAVSTEDGEECFQLRDGFCPFLDGDKLCRLQKAWGEKGLCESCRSHPRFIEEFGSLREMHLSLACPEAARLMLESDAPASFPTEESDEEDIVCDDVKPELLTSLLAIRDSAMELLQNRSFPLFRRAGLTLALANDAQTILNDGDWEDLDSIGPTYVSNAAALSGVLAEYRGDTLAEAVLTEWLRQFRALELLTPRWGELLDEAVAAPDRPELRRALLTEHPELLPRLEHLLVYFTYCYFPKADFDLDLLAKAKFSVLCTSVILELCAVRYGKENSFTLDDLIDIAHRLSREVEHDEENLDALREACLTADPFEFGPTLAVLELLNAASPDGQTN